MLGWPGQKPLLESTNGQDTQNDSSTQMNRLIKGLINDQHLKTIILTMRISNVADQISFINDLKTTITEIRGQGKEVIFIYPPPEIGFDPIECV